MKMRGLERLIDSILILEDAAYIRRERLAGDPSRDPDETTVEDVTESIMRRKPEGENFLGRKWAIVEGLRNVISLGVDLTE
ncbi:MAG TPA: hypothetical protein VFB03_01265 [Candidatus Saccharimonadales bacterium]|nr:hypothetical protein [Candidatus Saccharimonadales bacterium]